MVTFWICPSSSNLTNSLNTMVLSRVWNVVEKFQIRTPTTTSTIQNSKLLSVEFKLSSSPGPSVNTRTVLPSAVRVRSPRPEPAEGQNT